MLAKRDAGSACLRRKAVFLVAQGGQEVFPAGTLLSGAHLGVLASVGATTVRVHPRPKVGVLSTGDELVPLTARGATAALAPGQIRDSNRPMLLELVREAAGR